MREEVKEIVDLVVKEMKPKKMFETEHFLYWTDDTYLEEHKVINRERFREIKEYVIKNHAFPFKPKRGVHDSGTRSYELILRYSKTYGTLEYYKINDELRAVTTNKSDKVISIRKKHIFFKITANNFVKIGNKRWLSLKNWDKLEVNDEAKKKLMKLMLGKNWVERLVIRHCPVSNKDARDSKDISQMIEKSGYGRTAKLIGNVVADFEGIATLNKVVEPNQIHKLTNFVKENKEIILKLFEKRTNPHQHHRGFLILFYYFLSKDNRCRSQILWDYIDMLVKEERKINLNISSYSTIKKYHDDLSREIVYRKNTGGDIKNDETFPILKPAAGINVELIEDGKRLDLESKLLHHCVHSYKGRINSGGCVIYSIEHAQERYTLQLSKKGPDTWSNKEEDSDKEPEYYVAQLKGLYNCNPPIEMKSALETFLEENNLPPLEKNYIRLDKRSEKREEKKKEVAQIGAKVLEKVLSGEISDRAGGANDWDLPF